MPSLAEVRGPAAELTAVGDLRSSAPDSLAGVVRALAAVGIMLAPSTAGPRDAVCLLDVPTYKTGSSFAKPVDPLTGEAINAWQKIRPVQPGYLLVLAFHARVSCGLIERGSVDTIVRWPQPTDGSARESSLTPVANVVIF